MAHDVFVSYSQQDKAVADAVVARLEQDGTRCWIAPRDIVPGTSWGDAIVDAIAASRVMILVLSVDSSQSRQVIREVERAVSSDVVVLPFRIEDVAPTGAMAYFLGTEHWLDALAPPLERHIERLSRSVSSLLSTEQGDAVAAGPAPTPVPAPPPPPLAPWWRRIPRWALLAGGITIASIVAVGALSTGEGSREAATTTTPTTTTIPPTTTEPTTTTTTAPTTTTEATPETRYAYIFDLEVGDCFDDRGTPLIPIVPCETAHDRELFAILDYPEGPYPEDEDTSALCVAEFEPYVGIGFQESVLGLHKMVPSEDAWAEGERAIYCALTSMDGTQLDGSAAGTAR